jgi:serine/threonine protein kinase
MAFSIKDYSNLEKIGAGGMGIVYSALQRSLDRKVVIKKMALDLHSDSTLIKCFENEAKSAGALNHTNIIRIYDFGEDKGSFYITMEFIDGYHFEQLLTWRPFPKEIGLLIVYQALKGLHFAHQKGIAHCDIKPTNILISKTGRVVLTDFGIANAGLHSNNQKDVEKVWITPAYMPPEQAVHVQEQIMSKDTATETIPLFTSHISTDQIPDLDFRKDIWSIGVLLYRVLGGDLPYSGKSLIELVHSIQHLKERPILNVVPTLPDDLAAAINSCLSKEPRKRLSSVEPLIAALQHFIRDFGFHDSEHEIQHYLANKTSTSTAFEKRATDYHIRKGKELQAAGNKEKSEAHFDAAKKIVFDPLKNDQPIILYPSNSPYPVDHQENTSRFTGMAVRLFQRLKRLITSKYFKPVAYTVVVLVAIAIVGALSINLVKQQMSGIDKTYPEMTQGTPTANKVQPSPLSPLTGEVPESPAYSNRTGIKTSDAGTSLNDKRSVKTIQQRETIGAADRIPAMIPDQINSKQKDASLNFRRDSFRIKKNTPKISATETTPPIEPKSPAPRKKRSSSNASDTLYGTLTITMDPSTAYLFIDQQGVPSQEFISGKKLSAGQHEISVVADGYKSYKNSLVIEPNSTQTLVISLKQSENGTGFLHVYSYPWTDIYVDGTYQGTAPTPKPITLVPGEHSVQLRREGYKTYIDNIQVTSGEATRIQVTMEKE